MMVVQADGNDVEPVPVDQLRIAVAETYDVIVRPMTDTAYTIFAQPEDRTGFARSTLVGMSVSEKITGGHPAIIEPAPDKPPRNYETQIISKMPTKRLASAGDATDHLPRRVLTYADLRAVHPGSDPRPPSREIILHLTGNMMRFIWGFNARKFSQAEPIRVALGERVRFRLINDTMMAHPIHLHGLWSELENGHGAADYAARVNAYYDLFLTQFLVAEPQIEMNAYTQTDRPRMVGAGLSDIDVGLRVRYEFTRKFASYIGVAYYRQLGGTASLAWESGQHAADLRLLLGLWVWF